MTSFKVKASKTPALINETPVVLFIPRLLPTISKQYICDYFKSNKIGIVNEINAKYRVNENKNKYWFAFLNVQFFDTSYGNKMYQKIIEKEKTAYMFYDEFEGKYWEISVRSQDRKITKSEEKENKEEAKEKKELEEGEIYEDLIMNTHFTIHDHVEMYHDYREIEKEIYGNNAFSWSSYKTPSWGTTTTTWGTFIPLRI